LQLLRTPLTPVFQFLNLAPLGGKLFFFFPQFEQYLLFGFFLGLVANCG
jgi:hypothetical protein